MAYIKKDNYPSLKIPGVYPSGSVKELGLNTDNLEKFSLGSWEDFSLSNQMFVTADAAGNEIYEVQEGLDGIEKENLFGFAYIGPTGSMTFDDVGNATKLINYNNRIDSKNYISSSFPIKINFGLDFIPDISVSNYDQREAGQMELTLSDDAIESITNIYDVDESMETGGDYWPAVPPTGTVWGFPFGGWAIGYLNYKNPGDVVPEPIEPIVLNHATTPFIIKWHRFARAGYTGGITGGHIKLPNGAYDIIFDTPISKDDYPIKILDRVKLFSYWDHEFNVVDIRGGLNTISAIQLDILYPGDTSASGTAQEDMTLGKLKGEDWTFYGFTNKVGHMPAPFELRAGDDQVGSWDSLSSDTIAEAYAWAQGNFNSYNWYTTLQQSLGIDRKTTQQGGTPILRSEDMPSDYEIIISRPKSTLVESNLDFNRLIFQDDDIRTYSGDELISLFKEPIPRSPRQLSVDIPGQSINRLTPEGNATYQEYIGFKGTAGQGKTDIWNNSTIYGVAVSSQAKATNVTMRARHGAYNSGYPPDADTNNKAWGGNLDDNTNDRFPITTDRFPAYIEGDDASDTLKYPSLHLSKDSEFVIYPVPTIGDDDDAVEFVFEQDKLYRLKFNVRYARESQIGNNNYNVKIGIGILDKSTDQDANGTDYYIKALTSSHKETDLGYIVPTSRTAPVVHADTLYSEVFSNSLPPNILKGKPYITINVKLANGGSFPSDLTHRIFFQVTDYQIEEVTVDQSTDAGAAFVEALDISNTYLYKYKVLKWGDEKQKLTNEQLLNSFYLNWYNADAPSLWTLKQYVNELKSTDNYIKNYSETDNLSYFNLTSHVYNKPGLKSIKSIVYKMNQQKTHVFETKLLTTNIVINDGLLLSQDFSIFGGTDFNFLPVKDNQVIIGGLDEDSKYNNSVEKIKKDDNFIEEDYLERASSRDFIDNFNNNLLGKSPGQLDLGISRVFKGTKDIYYFITDDTQAIVDNNFTIDTLPINSLATDIFIDDGDCIVELVPQELEYLTIPNEVGTNAKAILIGDYKVNQPKGGAVQREGVMQTPMLEKNQDKQAF